MIHIATWKKILILAVILGAALFALPNLTGKDSLPSFLPNKTINLGLDLQGGSHLLLEVDVNAVLRERTEDLVATARPLLRENRIGYRRIGSLPDGMRLTLRDAEQMADAKRIIREEVDNTLVMTEVDGETIEARFSDTALKEIRDQTISQSIEIVRRRVDETGTNEPIIQRQGDERILVQLPGLDEPERVKELLGQTAKLSFHLVDGGSTATSSTGSLVLPMRETPGQDMSVERRAMITGDMLAHAAYSQDQNGQPAVSFRMNTMGANRFCDVSRENVGKPFAIVLDREIISAPVIREAICGGVGQISGSFTLQEASDLALLLRAGALPAPLNILEERTVGPSLGADSVEAGKIASVLSLIFVIGFMIIAYGTFGFFSSIALLVNVTLIVAILSGLQATLTLPGIAGIVLTMGMAVDANVLIFERIREEVYNGRSAMAAIDQGFKNAMSSIIDSNLTTLISAVILFSFGTGPIKGFAVTLMIGVLTSMFSAIMVTRLMVITWLNKNRNAAVPV